MDPNIYFYQNLGEPVVDPEKYTRLISKLIYLITRLDITFVVDVLSGYMQSPYQLHWTAACCILRYLKMAPDKRLYNRPSSYLDIVRYFDADQAGDAIDGRSSTDYCIFIGGNLVTW